MNYKQVENTILLINKQIRLLNDELDLINDRYLLKLITWSEYEYKRTIISKGLTLLELDLKTLKTIKNDKI